MDTPPSAETDSLICKELMWETALINKVKQHPQLYDFNHKDYKESRKCIQTWLSIAQKLGLPGQWKVCKERWRTLRDVYVRNRKSYLVGGERARRRPRWKFFDQMNFLHSYINHRAMEAEKSNQDLRKLWLGNDPPSIASDSDSNDASTVLLGSTASPTVSLPNGSKCKRELSEDGPEENKRNTKRVCFDEKFSPKWEKVPKQTTAVEDLEAALLHEADPLAFTLDGQPIKQEVEWTDEEVDMVDKGLPNTVSSIQSSTSPPPPPTTTPLPVEDKKPLMFKLKLPGGKSIPATFITDPKQAFIKRKVGMIMPTPLKSVPIKIKTVTGSQLRASSQASVLESSPLPSQGSTSGQKKENKDGGGLEASNSTSCPEQVHKPAANLSISQESALEDEEELFGRYVAAAIRKLTSRSKSLAKMRIQQVLFHLEESDRTGDLNSKDTSKADIEK